jgi:hypothetical protein
VIHETRVVKKVFPERLRGRSIVDAPDAREARPPP